MRSFKEFITEADEKIWTISETNWKSVIFDSIGDVEAMFLFGLNDSKLKIGDRNKYKNISAHLAKIQKSFDWKVIKINVKKVASLYKKLLKDILPNLPEATRRINTIKESLNFLNSILKMKELDFLNF